MKRFFSLAAILMMAAAFMMACGGPAPQTCYTDRIVTRAAVANRGYGIAFSVEGDGTAYEWHGGGDITQASPDDLLLAAGDTIDFCYSANGGGDSGIPPGTVTSFTIVSHAP